MENNSYLMKGSDDNWYCLLPNHIYKKIPGINIMEDIDWYIVYYKVYEALCRNKLTDEDILYWDLAQILEVIDIRI